MLAWYTKACRRHVPSMVFMGSMWDVAHHMFRRVSCRFRASKHMCLANRFTRHTHVFLDRGDDTDPNLCNGGFAWKVARNRQPTWRGPNLAKRGFRMGSLQNVYIYARPVRRGVSRSTVSDFPVGGFEFGFRCMVGPWNTFCFIAWEVSQKRLFVFQEQSDAKRCFRMGGPQKTCIPPGLLGKV
jgi:hypothetical protein